MSKAASFLGVGPREWSPRAGYLHAGKRVVLKRDVDRYPDFIAPAGLTGLIVEMEPDFIRVKMDLPVKGAEQWDNEVHWMYDLVTSFTEDVEVLDQKRGKR
jgi:hypothetical protein